MQHHGHVCHELGLAFTCHLSFTCHLYGRCLQSTFGAWRAFTKKQQHRRRQLAAAVGAVDLQLRTQLWVAALQFWHRHSMASVCERWSIPLPLMRPRLRCFDDWLWRHVVRQQAMQKATAWQLRWMMARSWVRWQEHATKVVAMREAWRGVSMYTRDQLLRWGIQAFMVSGMFTFGILWEARHAWQAGF